MGRTLCEKRNVYRALAAISVRCLVFGLLVRIDFNCSEQVLLCNVCLCNRALQRLDSSLNLFVVLLYVYAYFNQVIRYKLFTRWFTTLSALTLIGQLALWLPCKSGKFHPILTSGRASQAFN